MKASQAEWTAQGGSALGHMQGRRVWTLGWRNILDARWRSPPSILDARWRWARWQRAQVDSQHRDCGGLWVAPEDLIMRPLRRPAMLDAVQVIGCENLFARGALPDLVFSRRRTSKHLRIWLEHRIKPRPIGRAHKAHEDRRLVAVVMRRVVVQLPGSGCGPAAVWLSGCGLAAVLVGVWTRLWFGVWAASGQAWGYEV